MFTTKYPLKNLATILLLAFLLAACTSPAQTEPAQPVVETQEIEIEPTFSFATHEKARDIAVAYLAEKYGLEAPASWTVEDKTPQNMVGSSAYLYTSGDWSVSVQAPVVAPEYLLYTVVVDHTASELHWEGEVDADATLNETMATPPVR